jgi:hypothetical protein
MARKSKLQALVNIEGYNDVYEMLEKATFDSVAPGICTNEGCDYTTEVEPDCRDGWCEECETNTVRSCLLLAGII